MYMLFYNSYSFKGRYSQLWHILVVALMMWMAFYLFTFLGARNRIGRYVFFGERQ